MNQNGWLGCWLTGGTHDIQTHTDVHLYNEKKDYKNFIGSKRRTNTKRLYNTNLRFCGFIGR